MSLRQLLYVYEPPPSYDEAIRTTSFPTTVPDKLSREEAVEYLTDGNKYRIEGNYELAINYYKNAITADPTYAEAYSLLGLTYRFISQFQRAIFCYQKAIELLPKKEGGFYNGLAIVYMCLEEPENAIALLNTAIKIDSKVSVYFANRAFIYRSQGKYFQANEDYKEARTLDHNIAEKCSRGGDYCGTKEGENKNHAVRLYTMSLALKETFTTYHKRGNLYCLLQRYDEAISDYIKEILLDPHFINARTAEMRTKHVLALIDNLPDPRAAILMLEKLKEKENPVTKAMIGKIPLFSFFSDIKQTVEDEIEKAHYLKMLSYQQYFYGSMQPNASMNFLHGRNESTGYINTLLNQPLPIYTLAAPSANTATNVQTAEISHLPHVPGRENQMNAFSFQNNHTFYQPPSNQPTEPEQTNTVNFEPVYIACNVPY
jgi:tetratricopeptide (TPR) repeat protein